MLGTKAQIAKILKKKLMVNGQIKWMQIDALIVDQELKKHKDVIIWRAACVNINGAGFAEINGKAFNI